MIYITVHHQLPHDARVFTRITSGIHPLTAGKFYRKMHLSGLPILRASRRAAGRSAAALARWQQSSPRAGHATGSRSVITPASPKNGIRFAAQRAEYRRQKNRGVDLSFY